MTEESHTPLDPSLTKFISSLHLATQGHTALLTTPIVFTSLTQSTPNITETTKRRSITSLSGQSTSFILLTSLRLFHIRKRSLRGYHIESSYPLVRLKSTTLTTTNQFSDILTLSFSLSVNSAFQQFRNVVISLQEKKELISKLFSLIGQSTGKLFYGHPSSECPLIQLSNAQINMSAEYPYECALVQYYSICDFRQLPINEKIENLLLSALSSETSVLDLSYCFKEEYSLNSMERMVIPSVNDLRCLELCLRYCDLFTVFTARDVLIEDARLEAIGALLYTSYDFLITRLVLSKVGMSKSFVRIMNGVENMRYGNVIPLNSIDISDNAIQDQGFSALLDALDHHNIILKALNVSGTGITGKSVQKFVELTDRKPDWVKGKTALNILQISRNLVGKKGEKSLAEFIQSNKHLQTLELAHCEIHLSQILASLQGHSLRVLDISGNHISKDANDRQNLTQFITENSFLRELHLSKLKFPKKDYNSIVKAIAETKTKFSLFIRNTKDLNRLTLAVLNTVGKERINAVTVLDLTRSCHSVQEFSEITQIVKYLPQLVYLNVSNTVKKSDRNKDSLYDQINDFSKELRKLSVLEEFVFHGDEKHGLEKALLPLLNSMKVMSLRKVDISHNYIENEGFDAFIEYLKNADTLEYVNIDENNLSVTQLTAVMKTVIEGDIKVEHVVLVKDLNKRCVKSKARQVLLPLAREMEISCEKNVKKDEEHKKDDIITELMEAQRVKVQTVTSPYRSAKKRFSFSGAIELPKERETFVLTTAKWLTPQYEISLNHVHSTRVDGYSTEIPSILIFLESHILPSVQLLTGSSGLITSSFENASITHEQLGQMKQQLNNGYFYSYVVPKAWSMLLLFFYENPHRLLNPLPLDYLANSKITKENVQKTAAAHLSDRKRSILFWVCDMLLMITDMCRDDEVAKENARVLLISQIVPNLYTLENLTSYIVHEAVRNGLEAFLGVLMDWRESSGSRKAHEISEVDAANSRLKEKISVISTASSDEEGEFIIMTE